MIIKAEQNIFLMKIIKNVMFVDALVDILISVFFLILFYLFFLFQEE